MISNFMCQSIFTSMTCSIKFDPVKYQASGLYTNGDKTYYDGFVTGYMQIGKTKLALKSGGIMRSFCIYQ
jgi:hypothetical protein